MSNPGVLRQQLQHVQLMLKGTTQRMEAEEASFRLMLDQHQHRVHCLSAEINNLQRQEAQLFAAVVSTQSAADPDSPAQVGAMSPYLQHAQQHAPGIPAQQQQPHPATAVHQSQRQASAPYIQAAGTMVSRMQQQQHYQHQQVRQQAQPQPGLPSAQPAPSSSLSHAAAAKEFVPRPVQLHEQQAHHSQPATSAQPAAAAAFSPSAHSGAASAMAGHAAGAPGLAPPPEFDPGQQDRAQQALPGLGPSQQDHAPPPPTGRAAPPGFALQPGFRAPPQQQGAANAAAAEVAPKPADTSPLAASPLAAFPVPGQQHPRQQQASLQPPVMPLPEPSCAAAAAPAEGRAAPDQPEWDVHASSSLLSDRLQSSAPKAETQPPSQGHQHQPNGSRQPSLSSSGGSEAADAAAAEGGPGPGSQPRGKEKGRGSGAYEDLLRGCVGGKWAQQSRQGGLPAGEGQETALAVCGPQDFPSLGGASIGHSSSTTPASTAPAWANKWASGNLKAKLSAPSGGGSSTGTSGGNGSSGGWGATFQPGEQQQQQASIDLPGSAKRSVEEAELEAGLRVPVDVTPDAARRRHVQKQVFEQVEVQLKQRRKVNVLEGLELHRGVLTPAEQARVVEAVEHWVALGRSGHLRGRTFSAPKKWLPGKGRVTMQMGCCYNYATDSEGRPPGILSSELVEPMPPLLQALCRRLTRWGVLPAAKEPNSAIVNIYEEGDCIPPHVDSHDFTRPFCTLSLVSEESIMFAQKLVPAGPGKFEARDGCAPALIPLPLGSCLVLKGYGGDQAMHCVPPVRSRRISITLRRMGHEHGEAVRREVQAYEQRYGRLRGFWEDEERGVAADNGRRRGSNSGGAITIKSRQRKAQDAGTSPPAVHALSGWAGLHDDLLAQILHSVMAEASVASLKGWAAVLSTCASWRALAKQMPIDAACPPSAAVLAWLRRIRVRSLCFQHSEAAPLGDLSCQGFTCSEQRYRAAISTLLATTEFITHSAATLQELSGVHPREGILYLSPFRALQRISMTGAVSETCMLRILHGLPLLSEVVAAGYGEYHTDGLPASVKRLDLQWATQPGATFSTIAFHLPPHCALQELSLSSQRPLCLPSASLARCTALRLAARRAYLGLPLRPGAPWLDVDALAARFAEFMLGSPLEVIEVTATRCFVFQPVQEAFDLSTNDGVGGLAQQDQLATVLLARHFQSLHVEQRLLAAGAFRAFVCITRRRAEPMAFSFQAPLNAEQLNFLQQHALATSISFGPSALADSLAVLNCPAFAQRNAGLLQQLQNLELSSSLDLSPYSALQSIHGVWHSEPLAALGPAQLTSLRLTPALGAQPAQRCFGSRWLAGVKSLGSVTLVRFATADFSHLQAAPASVQLSSMQPPGGLVAPHTLQLPAAGFGPACSLSLRMAYAPPHAIHGGAAAAAAAGLNAYNNNGLVVGPGMLAVALQQQAAAMAGLAQEAAAVAAPGAAAAAAPEQQAAHAAMAQQAADAEAVAALAGEMLAEAQAALAGQQQQQQQEAEQHEEDLLGFAEQALQLAQAGQGGNAAAAGAAAAEVIDLVSDGEEEEEEEGEQGGAQVAVVGAGQQPGPAAAAVVAPHPAGGGGPDAAAAAALEWFGVEEMQDAEAALEAAEAAQQLQQGGDQGHPAGEQQHQQHHLPLHQAALAGGGGGVAQALGQEGMPVLVDSSSDDDEDEPMPALEDELMMEEVEGEVVDGGLGPGLQAGLPDNDGLGPWVIVPPPPPQQQEGGGAAGGGDDQQQQQQQQHAVAAAAAGGAQGQQGGMEFAQPWAMPDDLLSDVTVRHDALFSAAKHISVHAGALTIQFPGTDLEHLLQLLAGSGGACGGGEMAAAGSSGGGGMLRTLRLSARLLQFEGLPVGGGSGARGAQEQHQGGRRRFCGSQLRDYIAGSDWAALWGVKLQRAPLRDQETLMLARQLPPRLPATLDGSPAPMPGVAAFPPATL